MDLAVPPFGDPVADPLGVGQARALPSRPETGRVHLTVVGRPVSVAAGEAQTVAATHGFRRIGSAHRHAPQAPGERMGLLASTGLAVVSLVFVSAVALGSMLGSAAILHVVSPQRRFDAFRALHEPLVVGVLFGLGVLWLLPPHPWAVEPAPSEPKRRLRREKAAA